MAEIPRTLYNEEGDLKKRCGDTRNRDVISDIHNTAGNFSTFVCGRAMSAEIIIAQNQSCVVYTHALCQLVECCEMPCISALAAYEKALTFRLQELKSAKRELNARGSNDL